MSMCAFNLGLTCFRFSLVILFYQPLDTAGQVKPVSSETPDSTTLIHQLSQGTLIFILPDYAAKINSLEADLERVDLSSGKRKRTKKLLRATVIEKDDFQKELILAVDSLYDFSQKGFVYISDLDAFRGGDKTLLLEPSDMVSDAEPIFFMRRGTLESGADALVMYDQNMKMLQRPFPYYARLQGFFSIVQSLISTRHSWRAMSDVIESLNSNLHKFRQRSS